MKVHVNTDEYGAVYVVPKNRGALAGGTLIEVSDDFDFTKLHLYDFTGEKLVLNTGREAEEKAFEEQVIKSTQEYRLKDINSALAEALLRMLYIEDVSELPAIFASIREKYSEELTERDTLKEILYGPEEWVQPTGAHDAYPKGKRVMHNGEIWVSDVDDNVWEPGVHGWTKEER